MSHVLCVLISGFGWDLDLSALVGSFGNEFVETHGMLDSINPGIPQLVTLYRRGK